MYLMLAKGTTEAYAKARFHRLFNRMPDEIVQDHNYLWVGRVTEEEAKRLNMTNIIYDRPTLAVENAGMGH